MEQYELCQLQLLLVVSVCLLCIGFIRSCTFFRVFYLYLISTFMTPVFLVFMFISCWLFMDGLENRKVHQRVLPAGSILKPYGILSSSENTDVLQSSFSQHGSGFLVSN